MIWRTQFQLQTARYCTSYVLLLFLSWHPLHAQETASVTWKRLADRVDLGIARLPGTILPGEITLLRVSPKDFSPRVARAAAFGKRRGSVSWLAQSSNSPICINANFFDPEGKPLGLVVSRGVRYSRIHKGGSTLTGVLLGFKDHVSIVQRSNVGEAFGLEAVQAGPRLVVNGKLAKGLKPNGPTSRRSGVCTNQKGKLILFAITSALRSASLYEVAEVLLQPEIDCKDALNFDGGGSSQLYVDPLLPGAAPAFAGIDLPGRDDVPTALCLHPETKQG